MAVSPSDTGGASTF